MNLRCQQAGDRRDGLAEVLAIGVEHGQLDGTAGGIALTAALIAGHRRKPQTLGEGDGMLEVASSRAARPDRCVSAGRDAESMVSPVT